MAPREYGGSAYGGAQAARQDRTGGAIPVPGFDASYFVFAAGGAAPYGGSTYGGRRALARPAAGIAALPDPDAAAVTCTWWWAYGEAVTVVRVEPDGTRVPVRGAEGTSPVGRSRSNPASNPTARDAATGYSAGANTTVGRRTGLTGLPVDRVSTAIRGTATAAGQAAIVADLDLAAPAPTRHGFIVQTSALATTLGLAIEWFDSAGVTISPTTYPVAASVRTSAAAGPVWAEIDVTTWPQGAAVGVVSHIATGLPAAGWLQVTARILGDAGDVDGPGSWFDGDTLGGGWVGAAGLSRSILGPLQTVVDAEAPLDVDVVYELAAGSTPGWTVRSTPIRLDGVRVFAGSGRWGSRRRALLTHPGQARTVRVWIEDAPELTRGITEGRHRVRGRANLVVVQAGERDGATGSLTLISEDPGELGRLLGMLEVPSPMLLRLPAQLQYPPVWWLTFGEVTVAPLERSGRIPVRKLTAAVTTVDRPSVAAGLIAV